MVGHKPALVLLHGAGQASRMWRHQVAGLSDAFDVHAPDLLGFGATPGPFRLDGAVDQVVALLNERAPAHLCGLSLGSLVAARVAVAAPDVLRKLILTGPVITPAESGPRMLRFYRRRLGWWLMRDMSDLRGRDDLLALVAALAQADIAGDLPAIAASTLVLCGRRDRSCLPDARRMANEIPRARLVVVPHAGHLMPTALPKVFNNVVRGFLSTVDPK